MAKRREKHPLEDNPFVDGFLNWMGSEESQQSIDALDRVWPLLKQADVDARRRKIIWPDGQRLSIIQSAKRIHATHPDLPLEVIESKVVSWLELEFTPEGYSPEEFEKLERLTEKWVDDHDRRLQKEAKSPDS